MDHLTHEGQGVHVAISKFRFVRKPHVFKVAYRQTVTGSESTEALRINMPSTFYLEYIKR